MGGRNFETFGEDPFLSSAIAVEHISEFKARCDR